MQRRVNLPNTLLPDKTPIKGNASTKDMTRGLEVASSYAAIVQECSMLHVPRRVICESERQDGSVTLTEIDLLFFISIFLIHDCFQRIKFSIQGNL